MNSIGTHESGRLRRTSSFTLIELLVVITLIGALVGLMFPLLGGIRRKGERAKCMSNLRQITQAGILFATDFNGNLPYRLYWAYSNTPPLYYNGELWPYIKTKDILRCPSDKNIPPTACDEWRLSSYVMNWVTNNNSRCSLRLFRANDVFFFEANGKAICQRPDLTKWAKESGNPRVLGDRHDAGGHIGCFDGHVEWMSLGEWVDLANVSRGVRNRIWPSSCFQ